MKQVKHVHRCLSLHSPPLSDETLRDRFLALRDQFWPCEINFGLARSIFGLTRSIFGLTISFLALRGCLWPCKRTHGLARRHIGQPLKHCSTCVSFLNGAGFRPQWCMLEIFADAPRWCVTSFVEQTISSISIVLISEARIGRRNISIGNVWPN